MAEGGRVSLLGMLNRRVLLRAALAVSFLMPLSLTACEGMDNPLLGDPGDWEPEEEEYIDSSAIEVPEFDFLWERAKFMMQTEGYGIDRARTRRDTKHLVSKWKTMLAPVRFKGVRRRVWMDFEETEPNTFLVKCCVQAQRNEDIDAPADLSSAVWKPLEGGDHTRANLFIYKLEAGFDKEETQEEKDAKKNRRRR